jgi:glutamine amidotransferase
MKKISIINLGSGNLHSVYKAIQKVAGDEAEVNLITNSADLGGSSHIILPGVGAFKDCMHGLANLGDMREKLEQKIFAEKLPILGICVGMQMMANIGYEGGKHKGLGWIDGEVKYFGDSFQSPLPSRERDRVRVQSDNEEIPHPSPLPQGERGLSVHLPIPHMSWNEVEQVREHKIFTGIRQNEDFYFVHSYYFATGEDNIIASCDYGMKFPAMIGRDNILGVQFHPEKSQKAGLKLLENFISWDGK